MKDNDNEKFALESRVTRTPSYAIISAHNIKIDAQSVRQKFDHIFSTGISRFFFHHFDFILDRRPLAAIRWDQFNTFSTDDSCTWGQCEKCLACVNQRVLTSKGISIKLFRVSEYAEFSLSFFFFFCFYNINLLNVNSRPAALSFVSLCVCCRNSLVVILIANNNRHCTVIVVMDFRFWLRGGGLLTSYRASLPLFEANEQIWMND